MTWQAYLFLALWLLTLAVALMQGASMGRMRDKMKALRVYISNIVPVDDDDSSFAVVHPRERNPFEQEAQQQFEASHTVGHPDWRHPK